MDRLAKLTASQFSLSSLAISFSPDNDLDDDDGTTRRETHHRFLVVLSISSPTRTRSFCSSLSSLEARVGSCV